MNIAQTGERPIPGTGDEIHRAPGETVGSASPAGEALHTRRQNRTHSRAARNATRSGIHPMRREANGQRLVRLAMIIGSMSIGCSSEPALSVEMPLHLEEHLDAAIITGSEIPADMRKSVEWRFDQPQPDWKAIPEWRPPPPFDVAGLTRSSDGLRVSVPGAGRWRGIVAVNLPNWARGDWSDVIVKVRADSASPVHSLRLAFNLPDGGGNAGELAEDQVLGQQSPVVRDGAVHTYRLPVAEGRPEFRGPLRQLAIIFRTSGDSGSIELLSVSVVPSGAAYADSGQGVRTVNVGERFHRTLFTHAPSSHAYRLRVPAQGRLDLALGVLAADAPVTFAVTAAAGGGKVDTLLEERHADPERWALRSVDLSKYAGRVVTLSLNAAGAQGAVAFWGAPTVSGPRISAKPNVILYVIDGGGADFMSLYGYNRRTTPNLERLAAEGAVFERAYSNSSWTKPSTASFMTSLHNEVLGFTGGDFDPLPDQAMTMAQRFHAAGYQTGVFTSNPNAGTASGLQRGADVLRESEFSREARSSVELHNAFEDWRRANPGGPYWTHFQTTDVHAIRYGFTATDAPVPPFAGLFVSPEDADTLRAWGQRLSEGGAVGEPYRRGGVKHAAYLTLLQGLYDEQMAHNDYQLGRLIDRLKASGDWQNTLLIVTADHSLDGFFGSDMTAALDSPPPRWTSSTLRSTVSHVPLVVVWPGQIAGGQRFVDPVSLIDLLPTVLEFAGLPAPEIMQGQSLAPLLRGQPGWAPRPVIMDEIVTFGGETRHAISVIDGRWGATTRFGPPLTSANYVSQPWPVLLFDMWSDPMCIAPVNEAHPDLVKKYTAVLDDIRKDHETLATLFKPGAKIELSPAQLERLRALGYIR